VRPRQSARFQWEFPEPPRGKADFCLFYLHARSRMIALARTIGGDKIGDPEDAAQEGWTRFWPHWADCESPGGYLAMCVMSAVRDRQRAIHDAPRATSVGISGEDFAAAVPRYSLMSDQRPSRPPAGQDPHDPELAAALASLSDKDRAVLVLAHELEEERPAAEIAQILGIRRPAASMRLHRAHARLRRILPDGYPEERHEQPRAAWNLEERPSP
jgi:RNA polymerase sigma factor (sigma-70 family)